MATELILKSLITQSYLKSLLKQSNTVLLFYSIKIVPLSLFSSEIPQQNRIFSSVIPIPNTNLFPILKYPLYVTQFFQLQVIFSHFLCWYIALHSLKYLPIIPGQITRKIQNIYNISRKLDKQVSPVSLLSAPSVEINIRTFKEFCLYQIYIKILSLRNIVLLFITR